MALIDPMVRTDTAAPLTEAEIWARFDRLVAMRAAAAGTQAGEWARVGTSRRADGFARVIELDAAPRRPGPAARMSAALSGALGGVAALALAAAAVVAVALSAPASVAIGGEAPKVVAALPAAPVAAGRHEPVVAPTPEGPAQLHPASVGSDFPDHARLSPAATQARIDEATMLLAQAQPAQRLAAPGVRRSAAASAPRVILRASGHVDPSEALAALKAAGVTDVSMRRTPVAALTVQARFFHRQDRARAAAVLEALGSPAAPSDFTHLRHTPPRGVVEVLLPTPHDLAMRGARNSFN